MAIVSCGAGGSSGGSQSVLLGLSTDTKPTSYTLGAVGLYVETDTDTFYRWDGNAWQSISTGGATAWGTIGGVLSNQIDLSDALAGKSSTSHTHPAVDISDSTATGRSLITAATQGAARDAIALGDSATKNVGTLSTNVAAGDAVSTHEAAADPHTGYQRESEKAAASGYASLDASTLVPIAQVPTGTSSTTVCIGNDGRLSDARTPTTHATSHKSAGSDVIKLDELASPTDVTTLNVSTTLHGLFPKLPGGTTNFYREDGTWTTPPGGSQAFPIGAVFIAVVSTNPATLLGYGTWSAIAAGRVLIGLDSGDTDFDLVEETGGAKTVTSTGTVSQPTFTGGSNTTSVNSGAAVKIGTSASSAAPTAHTHTVTPTGTVSQPTYTGNATSVVQPYFVVYMWKRTA